MRSAYLCAETVLFGLSRSCCGLSHILCRRETNPSGFYSSLAIATGALQIWPEHRYYAETAPYTPTDGLAHLTIEQALVDHVELVLHIQSMFNFSSNPVIAIGSSYSKHCAVGCMHFASLPLLCLVHPDFVQAMCKSLPSKHWQQLDSMSGRWHLCTQLLNILRKWVARLLLHEMHVLYRWTVVVVFAHTLPRCNYWSHLLIPHLLWLPWPWTGMCCCCCCCCDFMEAMCAAATAHLSHILLMMLFCHAMQCACCCRPFVFCCLHLANAVQISGHDTGARQHGATWYHVSHHLRVRHAYIVKHYPLSEAWPHG